MAVKKQKGLGRGLGALLNQEAIPGNAARTVLELDINDVNPNRDQPRKYFQEEALLELADSIREHGVIQPIIVTEDQEHEGHYRIVAGERRWRAARKAGLKHIPAIVRELSELQVLQQALIENVQRRDLNVLEEARALQKLIEDFSMTQEQLALSVGKSRPSISNILRLLSLTEEVQEMLRDERISMGHARALLALEKAELQLHLAERIDREGLSVRETERLVKKMSLPQKELKQERVAREEEQRKLSIMELEERLSQQLGTRVKLKDKGKRGSILIEYFSIEERERLLDQLQGLARS